MTRILGISGSLRSGSYNTRLLNAARTLAPPDVGFETATLHGIPLYDGDLEQRDGIPATVSALKEHIMASDGVILVTPEYNNGIPGVFKNAIDWLSRPPADIQRVFGGRPFGLMGASTGAFGTTLSQAAWLPVLGTLGVVIWSGARLRVSRAGQAFDAEGEIGDEELRKRIAAFVSGFAEFASRLRR